MCYYNSIINRFAEKHLKSITYRKTKNDIPSKNDNKSSFTFLFKIKSSFVIFNLYLTKIHHKTMKKVLLPLLAITLFTTNCIKKEIQLDKISTPTMDPSFALPLGSVSLNLGNLERNVDANNFVYNDGTNLFEIVFNDRLFELSANDMINIPSQSYNNTFILSGGNQSSLLALPVGSAITFTQPFTNTFTIGNGALLDSVIIQSGQLIIDLSSEFMHNANVEINIPSLTLNGAPLQQSYPLNYVGSSPVTSNTVIDISGYTLDLTNNGTTTNTFNLNIPLQLTNSGNGLAGNEELVSNLQLDINSFSAIWGYLGQQTNILNQDTSQITLFDDLAGGQIHFEDPQIKLSIGNTAGLDVQAQFSAVFAPNNSTTVNLGGPGLNTIPIIARAINPGDTVITNHIIDNNNTSPTLTALLDEGPGEIVYSSIATTNPNGVSSNFVLGDAIVWCDAEIVLPIFGWARNFTLVDTTDFNAANVFGIDSSSNLTIEDVDKALVRIIVDNGLPIDAGVQIYFADTNHVIIDSLFSGIENVFEKGFVNFSLPLTDLNYGKVTQPTKKITDVVITQTLIKKLVNNNVKRLIYKARGLTNNADSGQNVKIYPEYTVNIKASAKVDFKIDLED